MVGLSRTRSVMLVLLSNRVDPGMKVQLDEACIQISIVQPPGTVEAASSILRCRERIGANALCFWGVRAETKFLVSKILRTTPVRLFDLASRSDSFDIGVPQPLLQHRLALTREQYLARLDGIVSARPSKRLREMPRPLKRATVWIPGVAQPTPAFVPLPPGEYVAAGAAGDRHVIGTASGIGGATQVDAIFEMYEAVARERADVSLLVIGMSGSGREEERMINHVRVRCASLERASFAANQDYVLSHIKTLTIFVTASVDDSAVQPAIEAMSLGIPVIALAGTPTADLIDNGSTGYIVKGASQMSRKVLELLRHARARNRLAQAAKARALAAFSESRAIESCDALFFQNRARPSPSRRSRKIGR
jgi:glycosyltransferase involved in cell wall biosynthesis